ncbi:lipoate--protein ligase family protein [candidate division TA06 bacterium]|nr:lipoate--protein ligase family protein [candidate division TA06 bacterium]
MNWRHINTGRADGAYNMALDLALAESVRSKSSGPVLRFYDWEQPTISLGYNQDAGQLDLEACRQAGVKVVRRPTGGRAVFHFNEFTYSVIALQDDPLLGGPVLNTYRIIAQALVAGLSQMGIDSELQRSHSAGNSVKDSPLCFAAAGRYEITAAGKKILGSAQRRIQGVILQQGSLLLAQDQNLAPFCCQGAEANATTAEELLGRKVGFEQAAGCMLQGFKSAWAAEFVQDIVTSAEQGETEKYLFQVNIL